MYSNNRKKRLKKAIKKHVGDYKRELFVADRKASERLMLLVISLATTGFVAVTALLLFFSVLLPPVSSIQNYLGPASTEIFDIKGRRLFTLSENEIRDVVPLENIPDYVKNATIAIEDDQFYSHKGFDVGGIVKGFLSQVGIGKPRGGSTITQQLVKNTFLTSERTIIRKMKEVILSTRLERKFDKEEILGMYLNQIPYGGTAYGVEQASEIFFNKDAKDLNIVEGAILASLPKAPTYYSPFGDNRYSQLTKQFNVVEADQRQIESVFDLRDDEYKLGLLGQWYTLPNEDRVYLPGRVDAVLKRMFDLGYIETEDEYRAAINDSNAYEFHEFRGTIKAHHFVFYIKNLLEEQFGKDVVESGGLKVYTSLDLDLQTKAEELVRQAAENNQHRGATNASLVSIENKTGYILAMVGSANFFDEEIDGNVNIVTAQRQPGSSFKPFVYATAFLNGYGPGSVIWDVQTKFGPNLPKNYDGTYVGPVTIRRALAQSKNIPAIKAFYLAEEEKGIIEQVSKMGIQSLTPGFDYGYPLALGSGELSQLELTHAYTAFGLNGKQAPLTPVLKVEDKEGNLLFEAPQKVKLEEVLDEEAAFSINSILSDKNNNLGPRLNLNDRPAAAKTGTTTKKISATQILPNDTWTVGYTPQITTSVWSGNSDSTPMKLNASGYSNAAPTWQAFMNHVHSELKIPVEEFERPKKIKTAEVARTSGLLASKNTPKNMVVTDIFPSYSVPEEVDDSFATARVDIRNGLLPNRYCPDEHVKTATFINPKPVIDRFDNWLPAIYGWLNNNEQEQVGTVFYKQKPKEESPLCKKELAKNPPSIELTSPSNFTSLGYGQHEIFVEAEAKNGIDRVEFYLDGKLQYTTKQAPYTGRIRITRIFATNGIYKVVAKVIDTGGFSETASISIKVGDEAFSEGEIDKATRDQREEPELEEPIEEEPETSLEPDPENTEELPTVDENFLPFEDIPTTSDATLIPLDSPPVINVTPF